MTRRLTLKLIITTVICVAHFQHARGQFVWMHGTNTINQNGVYGTLGVYASGNQPGGRSGATTWTDASGIFWLFGGNGYGTSGGSGRLSDLWKYNPSTNQWMWVKGPSAINNNGTYGTKGTAASANNPGAREVAANWIDNSGDVWIFAGFGRPASGSTSGYLSDLWKYNPSANQWTWMGGDSTLNNNGIYGTKGTPSASNKPSARYHSVGSVSASGNLFLYSGAGYGASGFIPGNTNDLWSYNISANQWTWLSGDSVINQTGVYGTKGTAASSNKPGSRVHAINWTDASGNLWIFSGHGRASTSTNGYLNDLWKYDVATGYWIWMSGDNIIDQTGVYNDSCSATAANNPGGRYASSFWKDSSTGLFWMFSGIGRASTSTVGELNDLWAYDVTRGYWSWTRGNTINMNGVYGTKGTPDAANIPGGRNHSSGWNDATALWTLGGVGYPASGGSGYLNDLWKLPFSSPCGGNPLPVGLLNFSSVCSDESVDLKWSTASEANADYFLMERSLDLFNFYSVGKVMASGNSNSIKEYFFTDNHPAEDASFYRLRVVNYNGVCKCIGKILTVSCRAKPEENFIYPNPNNGNNFSVNLSGIADKEVLVRITDLAGNILWQNVFDLRTANAKKVFPVSPNKALSMGTYFVRVTGLSGQRVQRFAVISE